MATFHLLNFGCRASQADGAALKRQLLEVGLEEVSSPEVCGVAVLNTCTVTASADAELRQVIRRIHRANPECRIVVTGCYAQRAPYEIAQLQGVASVIGNSHKHELAGLVKARLVDGGIPSNDRQSGGLQTRPLDGAVSGAGGLVRIQQPMATALDKWSELPQERPALPRISGSSGVQVPSQPQVLVGEITDAFHFAPVFPDDRTRPTLKVQDGCNARCSFCIIPDVRGPSRSLTPDKVIEQVRALEAAGYKEIVLSGINLGSYGKDLDRRITFLGLLERILDETAIARLRISSIEPMDVSPELIHLVAREPRLARHFHVPLQSGSDRILRLMNRRYWAAQYAERIRAIDEQIPGCGIGADVMVGFPGETEEDHSTSARLIESLAFTYLHVFPYSSRPGTPAAARSDHVNGRLARERSQEIRSIIALKRRAFLERQIGQALSALTLDDTEHGNRAALSSNYLKLALPKADAEPNQFVDVRVRRMADGILYGHSESK